MLESYTDDQEILVETLAGGFESPVVYVTGVRQRQPSEYGNAHDSEYVASRPPAPTTAAVVIGTALGAMFSPL